MNYSESALRLFLTTMISAMGVTAAAATQAVTYRYTGTIDREFRNEIGFDVPIGAPASIEFAFDPLTPDNQPSSDKIADYLFSGGATRLQTRIGAYVSSVATEYRVTVIASNCNCATDDQYNLLSFASQGRFIEIDFPGFLEDAEVQLFFRQGRPPIETDALFTTPPDPQDFGDARLMFFKRAAPGTGASLIFWATLEPGQVVPEPGSAAGTMLSIMGVAILLRRS